MPKKIISIILPIFNESENLPILYRQLSTVLDALAMRYEFEIIMINDGSRDSSWSIISSLSALDNRIKGISFSRNFGHQIAISAGYDYASGDAIITMDADLQHPPELIPELIGQWESGAYIVYVRNTDPVQNFFKRITSSLYYSLLDSIVSIEIPRHIQDFRLIDKKVLRVIRQSKEKSPYLRGMVAWTGYRSAFIDAPYAKRQKGASGYSLSKMIKLAFDGVTGFSLFPLKIASYIGLFVIFTGFLMFAYVTIDALLFRVHYPLYKWLIIVVYLFIGILFLLLWLIGEYIGRIYEELRARPLYVVADTRNFVYEKNSVEQRMQCL
ncbi:MAG TPA: glycosyltransferase family 2 protein [Candidatus Babeliales bacterium]|nr:glycosyltransferase family 2 protein [Candidatus Babeliales bacterium]